MPLEERGDKRDTHAWLHGKDLGWQAIAQCCPQRVAHSLGQDPTANHSRTKTLCSVMPEAPVLLNSFSRGVFFCGNHWGHFFSHQNQKDPSSWPVMSIERLWQRNSAGLTHLYLLDHHCSCKQGSAQLLLLLKLELLLIKASFQCEQCLVAITAILPGTRKLYSSFGQPALGGPA